MDWRYSMFAMQLIAFNFNYVQIQALPHYGRGGKGQHHRQLTNNTCEIHTNWNVERSNFEPAYAFAAVSEL